MPAVRGFCLFILCLSSLPLAMGQAGRSFGPEMPLTAVAESATLSVNPQSCLLMDARGILHLAYMAVQPQNPSFTHIFYRSIQDGIVSAPALVDNSAQGGARNPAMVLDQQDTLHIVWNDTRHCTASGNWIDNVEIFYDKKPVGQEFSSDIRLTNTQAIHKGDNGFAPRIAAAADGRLAVTWYDFHDNGNNAKLYLKSSDAQGLFDPDEPISTLLLPGLPFLSGMQSLWMPSLAFLPEGSLAVVWGLQSGFSGFLTLQGLEQSPSGESVSYDFKNELGGRFIDPPRLLGDAQGNLALAYTVLENGVLQVKLRYKPWLGVWTEPFSLSEGYSNAQQPTLAFSSDRLFIAWQDDRDGWDGVFLAAFDPQTGRISPRQKITSEDAIASTPAMTIHPLADTLAIAWCDKRDEGTTRLYAVVEQPTSVWDWHLDWAVNP